jgi:hypothetical protein
MRSRLLSVLKNYYGSWLLWVLLAGPLGATAQSVGIGTITPDAKAALDISATGKGLLIPRMDSATRAGIGAPPDGLMVFQTDGRKGFWYAMSNTWLYIPDKTRAGDNLGNHTATRSLNLQGNALTGTGASIGSAVGVGVRADGGLNLGQNTLNNNVLLGYQAGAAITTGGNNLFVGYQAGAATTTGYNSQFSGYQSGIHTTTGYQNQFNGLQSGYSNTTGSNNHFSGLQSGFSNTTGYQNQFNGFQSGYSNTTGVNSQFSGFQSGFYNTTGYQNQFTGYQSGYSNTTGSDNQFSGFQSGYSNTTGSNNQFSGFQSGNSNTTSSYNQFSGYRSGFYNTTGSANLFVGYRSGYSNTTGNNNQFSGLQSGINNTTGNTNQFNGYQSGYSNTTGSNNQFSGFQSGVNNTTGSNNWAFGYGAGPTVGNLTNAGAIGYRAQVSQSNSLVLGGTGTNTVRVGIGTEAPLAPFELQAGSAISATATGTETELRLTRPGTGGSKWNASAELALGTYAAGINSQSQLDFRLGNGGNNAADQTVLSLRGDGQVEVGQAVTTPATGAANVLAAGYGAVYGTGSLYNATGNVTVAHSATGEYLLTFTGPLATADFGSLAVSLTLYNGPGFVSFVGGGGAGRLLVRTHNTSGTLTDRGFSFVVFQP